MPPFLIKLGTPIAVELKAAPGVVLYVKPCTVPQYRELATLPNWPENDKERDEIIRVVGRHLDRVTGLEVEGEVGKPNVQIHGVVEILDHCPPWVMREVMVRMFEVSRLSPGDLGNSARPSSGGESTAPVSTAAPAVDRE